MRNEHMLSAVQTHQCSCSIRFSTNTNTHMCARAKTQSLTLTHSRSLSLELVHILLSANSMCHDIDFRNSNITSTVGNTYSCICFVRQCFAICKVIHHSRCRRRRRKIWFTTVFFVFRCFNIESITLSIKWIHYNNIQLTAFNLHWTIEIAW